MDRRCDGDLRGLRQAMNCDLSFRIVLAPLLAAPATGCIQRRADHFALPDTLLTELDVHHHAVPELRDSKCQAGACNEGETNCLCSPNCGDPCAGKECGDDGCGGTCGQCGEFLTCDQGLCECEHMACQDDCCPNTKHICYPEDKCCLPYCADRQECGDDGCGGTCGVCQEGYDCNEATEDPSCEPDCEHLCYGRECGSAGNQGECDCGNCSDDNPCTTDTCAIKQICEHLKLTGPPFERGGCDDGNPCTEDVCFSGKCDNPLLPQEQLVIEECPCVEDDDCEPLEDDDVCNGTLVCGESEGVCEVDPGTVLECDDGDVCNGLETCDPTDGCQLGNSPECDDQDKCTVDSCSPQSGCEHEDTLADCDDDIVCTTDICHYNQCGNEIVPNMCLIDGNCWNSGVKDPGNPCRACDPYTPTQWSFEQEGVWCGQDNSCDGQGNCVEDACIPDCDGKECGNDACGGQCGGCNDGNPCTMDLCDFMFTCKHVADAGAEVCDDGDACTTEDICVAGICVGVVLKDCSDGLFCNGEETCDPDTGACVDGEKPESSDGIYCTVDYCDENSDSIGHSPQDADCDDSNPCTIDVCSAQAGCEHAFEDDGEPCPGGNQYQCLSGNCTCVPDCDGKVCGTNGCGGSCGDCGDEEACNAGTCEPVEDYVCADMMACGMACGFGANCVLGCYGQADAQSKGLFEAYAMCLMTACGFNMTPGCILTATAGACSYAYNACAADE